MEKKVWYPNPEPLGDDPTQYDRAMYELEVAWAQWGIGMTGPMETVMEMFANGYAAQDIAEFLNMAMVEAQRRAKRFINVLDDKARLIDPGVPS